MDVARMHASLTAICSGYAGEAVRVHWTLGTRLRLCQGRRRLATLAWFGSLKDARLNIKLCDEAAHHASEPCPRKFLAKCDKTFFGNRS
jgi:hypothetical protein